VSLDVSVPVNHLAAGTFLSLEEGRPPPQIFPKCDRRKAAAMIGARYQSSLLTAPRYETRLLPVELRRGNTLYAVFDTFQQKWCSEPASKPQSDSCARAANRRCEESR